MLSVLVSAGLSLYVAGTSSYPAHGNNSKIVWGKCDQSVVNDTTLSCGFLDVPLDYHDPSVGNARLALVKANATGKRLGTVFFNPGGPGDSGVGELSELKKDMYAATGGAYDIVSWDPRGVGLTVPGEIHCFDNLQDYTAFYNGTIELTSIEQVANFTNPADVNALLAQAPIVEKKYEDLKQKCLDSPNGKYLKYLGTAAAVRDLVSMADVLEGPDKPINYIGISYGTLIGSWFVNMFPERVGKVIINGVVNPMTFATERPSVHFSHQFEDSDAVYKGLITGCALTGPSGCPAASEGDGPLDIDAKMQALLTVAHNATVANASVPLSSGNIRMEILSQLYSPGSWARFMNEDFPAAVEAVIGEATGNTSLSRRFEGRTRRNPPLKRATSNDSSNDSPPYSIHAIFCGDSIDPEGDTMEETFEGIIDLTRNVSHITGSAWPSVLYRCPWWPVRSVERYQGPFNNTLPNKIIVASNVYDPVTPLSSAQKVAKELGESAVLVMQNGFGHSTIAEPSACTNKIFAAYMVNGTIPANNTMCEVDADHEVFPGVTTAEIIAHLPSIDV